MQVSVMTPNPAATAMMVNNMKESTRRQSMAMSMSSTMMVRTCTDLICLAIYAILVAICFGTYYATQSGAVLEHNLPRDFDHNPCIPPYNYLYIPTIDPINSICVSICPLDPGIYLECQPNSLFSTCPMSVENLIRD